MRAAKSASFWYICMVLILMLGCRSKGAPSDEERLEINTEVDSSTARGHVSDTPEEPDTGSMTVPDTGKDTIDDVVGDSDSPSDSEDRPTTDTKTSEDTETRTDVPGDSENNSAMDTGKETETPSGVPDDSETSSATDTGSESESITNTDFDTGTADTATIETVEREIEVLYSYPGMENGIGFGTIEVDDRHIYFSANGLYRLEKDGGTTGDPEWVGGEPSGFTNQNLYIDETHVYQMAWTDVEKIDKETLEQTVFPIIEGLEDPSIEDEPDVMTGDAERLYFTQVGCEKIISIAKDGTDYRECSQQLDGIGGGIASLAVDDTHVYCSGSSGDMFRCPKAGGPLEYVTNVVDQYSARAWGPQVDPMVFVGDLVYYLDSHKSGSYRAQRLSVAPKAGGESTELVYIVQASDPHRLHYDSERQSLYWLGFSAFSMFKYDLITGTLSSAATSIPSKTADDMAQPPTAQDADFLYWPTANALRRMEKF